MANKTSIGLNGLEAVFFDLDNTLYDQSQYNMGVFDLISRLMHDETGMDKENVFEKLVEIYNKNSMNGGKNLNELVSKLNINIPTEFNSEDEYVTHLVKDGYHSFNPGSLAPYDGVVDTLKELKIKGIKLGLITDGYTPTQKRKVEALRIVDLFDTIVYSAELNNNSNCLVSKSNSELPYLTALNNVEVSQKKSAMMVGDNPLADFHFANRLVMITVRVTTGEYSSVMPIAQEQHPNYTIKNIKGILQILK